MKAMLVLALLACSPVLWASEAASGAGAYQSQSVSNQYQWDRERLQRAQATLRQLKNEAAGTLRQQLSKAQEQLNALGERLEQAARSSQQSTITAARKLEESIGIRTRRVEARALLLEAKADTALAKTAAAKQDFIFAERRLADATELLRRARAILYGDHAYDDELDDMQAALGEASFAIKSSAQNAQAKISQVLKDTDRVVGSLESDEQNLSVIKGQ
jgi:multidrug resistance efflux pump